MLYYSVNEFYSILWRNLIRESGNMNGMKSNIG